jgi:hypothetical protein
MPDAWTLAAEYGVATTNKDQCEYSNSENLGVVELEVGGRHVYG